MDLTKDQVKQRIIEEIDNSKDQIINFAKDIAEMLKLVIEKFKQRKKCVRYFLGSI